MRLTLAVKNTALVIVDLQHGIVHPEPMPFGARDIIMRAAALGRAFEQRHAPIVVTVTDFAAGYADAAKGAADSPWALPADGLPANFASLVPEIEALRADVRITKRQMSAFFGTELDLQLRRRRCETIVLCGVATNFGVEATARTAFDLNYNVIVADDACGSVAPGLHEFAVERVLPRIARVRTTAQILAAMNE